jgi:hypothetical protein
MQSPSAQPAGSWRCIETAFSDGLIKIINYSYFLASIRWRIEFLASPSIAPE